MRQIFHVRILVRHERLVNISFSRGLAGVAGRSLVVNLPGSTGGVKDALAVLADVVGHAVDQIEGGDHS